MCQLTLKKVLLENGVEMFLLNIEMRGLHRTLKLGFNQGHYYSYL